MIDDLIKISMIEKSNLGNTYHFLSKSLFEKAKNTLLNSNSPISEIAFDLGFDYPQHFSKLFKSKVGMNPTEYRKLN